MSNSENVDMMPVFFQCSLCRAVWWFRYTRKWDWFPCRSFSALSVEPYGGSLRSPLRCKIHGRPFSALSVEPYGGSFASLIPSWSGVLFQCSLCRAVWWFVEVVPPSCHQKFFQCSLCRAVWWFVPRRAAAAVGGDTFSALSVEPYGGSASSSKSERIAITFSALSVEPYGGSCARFYWRGCHHFQCSLCRAVWWFVRGR